MSDPEARLAEDRANSRAARAVVEAEMAQIKADLAARGIGGRIADTAGEKAKAVADEALEVARDNKAVIAGTIGALALWVWRKPLLDGSKRLYSRLRHRGDGSADDADTEDCDQ
ncbi:MAG: hypothetical protein ACREBO_09105 [Novosphingobium sp.]